jgi:hypothetical protein
VVGKFPPAFYQTIYSETGDHDLTSKAGCLEEQELTWCDIRVEPGSHPWDRTVISDNGACIKIYCG